MNIKTLKVLLLSIIMAAVSISCSVEFWHPDYVPSTGGGRVSVTGVVIDKKNTYLTVGGTETFTATVLPYNATNQSVTWRSSDTSIVEVSSSGAVFGRSAGIAFITITTVDGR